MLFTINLTAHGLNVNATATATADLPHVNLFEARRSKRECNLERRSREGERERCKSREVDLLHLQECESEREFFGRKT